MEFHHRYQIHFRSKTRSVFQAASHYLNGLMQASRKNMERMEEVVMGADEQQLQYMLTESNWDHQAVLDQVAQDADTLLGGTPESCLLIDESSFAKKGKHSVGVARQWCGRLGKVDNCQVGVFAALGCGNRATLIDSRLYLPKEWTDNPVRCHRAGIPEDQRAFRSKAELALAMVAHQRAQGIRFAWVGADAGYGKEPAFLRGLDAQGETFLIDVHKDQRIYLDDPDPQIPEDLPTGRGRKPQRRQAQQPAQRVDAWAAAQPASAWQRVTLRDSTRGPLQVDVLHRRVWLWDGKERHAQHWHLIVRRETQSPETLKYSLSNAPTDTPVRMLAEQQGQRFWIERSLQDAKSEAGLADYQARKWSAWHHHMALVCMALLFMLEERERNQDALPLLSCSDIEELLKTFLPSRNLDPDEVIRQMEKRHRKRQQAIDVQRRKRMRFDGNQWVTV
jgi:SRSO17 transposase